MVRMCLLVQLEGMSWITFLPTADLKALSLALREVNGCVPWGEMDPMGQKERTRIWCLPVELWLLWRVSARKAPGC